MRIQLSAVLSASLLAPIASAADYAFTQVDYPGTVSTQIFSINDRGDAVGNGLTDPTSVSAAPFVYRWKRGGFKQLPTVSSDTATHVLGINDAGVLVGSVFSPEAAVERAFIRGTDGTYTLLFHPDAENMTEARGISDSGLVTGFRDVLGGGSAGFIYNPATDVWLDVAPSVFTIAQGINGSGEVVGSAHFNDNEACPGAAPGRYGWLRAPDGSITYFQVNGKYTEARGINDAGFIAGTVIDHETEIRRGFVVQASRLARCESITLAASELLEFPGFDATIPEAITNKGVVVGGVYNNSDMVFHSFVATPQ